MKNNTVVLETFDKLEVALFWCWREWNLGFNILEYEINFAEYHHMLRWQFG